jgi:hypothetical protein
MNGAKKAADGTDFMRPSPVMLTADPADHHGRTAA